MGKGTLAQQLRLEQTPAERRFWAMLYTFRQSGWHFRRQAPIGPYIADFVCLQRRLIVEADGGQHAESGTDVRRDAYLRGQGFRVLRFWNSDIFETEEGVLTSILDALQAPLPDAAARRLSLPRRGGRDLNGATNA